MAWQRQARDNLIVAKDTRASVGDGMGWAGKPAPDEAVSPLGRSWAQVIARIASRLAGRSRVSWAGGWGLKCREPTHGSQLYDCGRQNG
jgi:hypothetical protein